MENKKQKDENEIKIIDLSKVESYRANYLKLKAY
jgi:hypothetical protein